MASSPFLILDYKTANPYAWCAEVRGFHVRVAQSNGRDRKKPKQQTYFNQTSPKLPDPENMVSMGCCSQESPPAGGFFSSQVQCLAGQETGQRLARLLSDRVSTISFKDPQVQESRRHTAYSIDLNSASACSGTSSENPCLSRSKTLILTFGLAPFYGSTEPA